MVGVFCLYYFIRWRVKMKKDLRQTMLKKLSELSQSEKAELTKRIHANLFNSEIWKQAQVIGITLSTDIEWDTYAIIDQAWRENKDVYVPITDEVAHTMRYCLIHSFNDLQLGAYNLYEPCHQDVKYQCDKQAIDLMIVPGVVFDQRGYRIGFGKGYFDRFLSDYQHHTVSILAESQLIEEIPINAYDISVDYLVTEARFFQVD